MRNGSQSLDHRNTLTPPPSQHPLGLKKKESVQSDYKDKRCEDRRLVVTATFCVITFEPIEIQTRSSPQNDRLNLISGKLPRKGWKTTIYISWVIHVQKNIFAFCVITFELIEFQTRSAPQNDRLNLRFVKYIYVK